MDRLRNFGFLLKEVSRRYVLRFEQRAQAMSLTLPTCKVLAYLERNEGASQAKLAELTHIEPMAMVRLIDRMETEGLLERHTDPADRRARNLYLTPKAKPALEEIWRLAALTRSEAFAGVNQQDRNTFLNVLEQLHSNLVAIEDQPIEMESPGTTSAPTVKGRSRKQPVE